MVTQGQMNRRNFALERSRSAILRGYRRIQKILTTLLHSVTCKEWLSMSYLTAAIIKGMFYAMQ